MIDNYNNIPSYLWYRVRGNPPTMHARWLDGRKYAAFMDEPDKNFIDKYQLTYVGSGDYDYIEGVV